MDFTYAHTILDVWAKAPLSPTHTALDTKQMLLDIYIYIYNK